MKFAFIRTAGHGTESRANRRLNFHNTTTKLAIPHEFFQRTVPSNKRITALVMSNNHQRLEGSSSLDSVTQPVVGKFIDVFLVLQMISRV